LPIKKEVGKVPKSMPEDVLFNPVTSRKNVYQMLPVWGDADHSEHQKWPENADQRYF